MTDLELTDLELTDDDWASLIIADLTTEGLY